MKILNTYNSSVIGDNIDIMQFNGDYTSIALIANDFIEVEMEADDTDIDSYNDHVKSGTHLMTLYKVRVLKDFGDYKTGELAGYCEHVEGIPFAFETN